MEKYTIGSIEGWYMSKEISSCVSDVDFHEKIIPKKIIHGVNCPKKNFGPLFNNCGEPVEFKPDQYNMIELDGIMYCARCGAHMDKKI